MQKGNFISQVSRDGLLETLEPSAAALSEWILQSKIKMNRFPWSVSILISRNHRILSCCTVVHISDLCPKTISPFQSIPATKKCQWIWWFFSLNNLFYNNMLIHSIRFNCAINTFVWNSSSLILNNSAANNTRQERCSPNAADFLSIWRSIHILMRCFWWAFVDRCLSGCAFDGCAVSSVFEWTCQEEESTRY